MARQHGFLDLAETFPKTKFHGIDISFVFPDIKKPYNAEFVTGNITKNISYPDNTFDYIHQRLLIAALTSDNWVRV